jgi:hypothetical protein
MVHLDSEDLCYRKDTVITNAISKYGSESYHSEARIGTGNVHVSEKCKNNKTLVDVKNIFSVTGIFTIINVR